jgi:hypothetical protein
LIAIRNVLILRRPPLRDAACGASSRQGGRLEGRTAPIVEILDRVEDGAASHELGEPGKQQVRFMAQIALERPALRRSNASIRPRSAAASVSDMMRIRKTSAISTSVNRRRLPNPSSLTLQLKGTVGRGKCLTDGTRRQREVPDELTISGKYWRGLGTGAIFMTITAKDFYRSSNGDRWQLIRDTASGRSFVRHEPNLSSGGRTTDTDVEEFLNRTGSSPENLALRALLDKKSPVDGR